MVEIRSAYDIIPSVKYYTEGETLTQLHMQEECDINNILRKYLKTGVINHINANKGMYADLPPTMDFQEAIAVVEDAQEAFSTLPGSVRKRFDNDPEKFLYFMHDPQNKEEMYELGLAERPKDDQAPQTVEPVSEVPPTAPEGA